MNFFWRFPYFQVWDYENIKSLSQIATLKETYKGQVVLDEDSEMDHIYFIKSGIYKVEA